MTGTPENPGRNQAGRFGKGASGNPGGKPKGARHKLTLLAEKMIGEDAGAVLKVIIAAAKAGDVQAGRLILERILPPRKDRPVAFALPPITCASDAAKAMAVLTAAVATGELTPAEGREIAGLVEIYVKTIEASEFEQRIAALEQNNGS